MLPKNPQIESFLQAVAKSVDEKHLLSPGQSTLLGVSGGADSMGLLHAFATMAQHPKRQWRLTVVHVNHQLRPEAVEEETFVQNAADALQLPCVVQRVDVAARAEADGQGIEAAARDARYECFRRIAEETGATAVAVAHHADDAAETILFRLLRGTGFRGLSGMSSRRKLSEDPPIELIRPLLEIPGQVIRSFCQAGDISWREDPSNNELQFRRNFIRQKLLPMIREQINPQADEALRRLGRFAEQADALLTRQADTLLRKSLKHKSPEQLTLRAGRLNSADPLLRSTALHLACRMLRLPERELTAWHIEEVAGLLTPTAAEGSAIALPAGATAKRKGHELILSR